jgi:hypothetical protein
MTTTDPTGHWGWPSWKQIKSVASVVVNPVATFRAAVTVTRKAYHYVSSGRAWKDAKRVYHKAKTYAKKAAKVVRDSTVRWAKKKYHQLNDAYTAAKKCTHGGLKNCAKSIAKQAIKKAVATVKDTVTAFKKDPWKFVATAAAGLVATIAVGALCATGVGCLILAGAVAGAMSSGAGYMVDVARGDEDFSLSGLAGTMIEGGLDGALSAGISKFTGGANRLARGAAGKALGGSGAAKLAGAGKRAGGGRASDERGGRPEPQRSSGGSCPVRHSFDPSTRVLMADASTKPIGEIAVGERVASTDPISGERAAKPVVALHRNVDRDLTNVTVRNKKTGDTTVLKTTQHHPFWDATDHQWVDAAKLRPGHRLLAHDDKRLEGDSTGAGSGGGGPGAAVDIVKVDNVPGAKVMRDLTVADIHTYYVVADDVPVLVHNNSGPVFDHCEPIGPVEPNGKRPAWSDRSEGPAPKYNRRTQYSNMSNSDRQDALATNTVCPYCGNAPSTQADHVYPVREHHQTGGWEDDKETRSADVNQRGNLVGACQPCNGGGGKSGKVLGSGPGQFWPPAWPRGSWWPFGGGPG